MQEEVDEPMDEHKNSMSPLIQAADNRFSGDNDGSYHSPLGYGMKHLDLLDENLHAESRARKIGFIGMSSQVRWLHIVAEARTQQPRLQSLHLGNDSNASLKIQTSSLCYWADGGSHSESKSGLNIEIEQYRLPPFEIAQELLTSYAMPQRNHSGSGFREISQSQFRPAYEYDLPHFR